MTEESAVTLLHEVDELRRRTRRDRHAYWPPMLLLGVLILAAPLVYTRVAVLPDGLIYGSATPVWRIPGTNLDFMPLRLFGPGSLVGDATTVAVYWLCVVVLGMAATVVWYRWRGGRVGVETSTRTFVLVGAAGLLYLLGILPLVAGLLVIQTVGYYTTLGFWLSAAVFVVSAGAAVVALRPLHGGRRPFWRGAVGGVGIALTLLSASSVLVYASIQGYAPLLVIAVALFALVVIERSVLCTVIAVLFAAAALLANLYNMENEFYRFGLAYNDDPRLLAFAHLVLPALVLIVGGAVAAVTARRTTR